MSTEFDPYYVWLGISEGEQPPSHYRLLGVDEFETNICVIENAADRQAVYLRTFQSGDNVELAQRILNEISAARVCLLSPKEKEDYDRRLREQKQSSTAEDTQPPSPESVASAFSHRQKPKGLSTATIVYGTFGLLGLVVIIFAVNSMTPRADEKPNGNRASSTGTATSDPTEQPPRARERTKNLSKRRLTKRRHPRIHLRRSLLLRTQPH